MPLTLIELKQTFEWVGLESLSEDEPYKDIDGTAAITAKLKETGTEFANGTRKMRVEVRNKGHLLDPDDVMDIQLINIELGAPQQVPTGGTFLVEYDMTIPDIKWDYELLPPSVIAEGSVSDWEKNPDSDNKAHGTIEVTASDEPGEITLTVGVYSTNYSARDSGITINVVE